ncbi:hypothetical protein PsorP6_009781 [Peronosclerospora sorghi]|uniref:Uncharacterized protein n=1 Tax=Peronosclerospora sorghi TaxID=230839 RepID=A0ACC0VYV6_9STRA|nr:hypothetical protein PsorP6_009781 [Peronosclerospora sorghi]
MVARQPLRLLRLGGHPRRAYTNLVDRENHVPSDQKLFTTSKAPTYMKRPSDKPLLAVLVLGLGLGFLQSFRGEISMATGTGKKE